MSNPKHGQKGLIFSIVVLGIISRFLPHPPNVTAVAAVSLFAGAVLNSRVLALLLPIVLMYISDFAINNTISRAYYPDHEGLVLWTNLMTWVYSGYAVIVLIGSLLLKKRSMLKVVGVTFLASTAFWILSNFGSFLLDPMYPKTVTGLVACYEFALPFFRNSLIGNLVLCTSIFGIYDYINVRYFQAQGAVA